MRSTNHEAAVSLPACIASTLRESQRDVALVVPGLQESYMSHRGSSLGGLNIHEAPGGAKSSPSGKAEPSNVTRAAAGVVLAAMGAGLSHQEAVDLAAVTALAGVACVVNPEMADQVRARLYATTVNYVVAKRVRRAA